MNQYDTIIISGGPAGAMTRITLQKKGYKTCIIDKSAFPREKPTATATWWAQFVGIATISIASRVRSPVIPTARKR